VGVSVLPMVVSTERLSAHFQLLSPKWLLMVEHWSELDYEEVAGKDKIGDTES